MVIKLEFLGLVTFRIEYQKTSANLAQSEILVAGQGQEIDNIIRQKDKQVKVSTFYSLPSQQNELFVGLCIAFSCFPVLFSLLFISPRGIFLVGRAFRVVLAFTNILCDLGNVKEEQSLRCFQ